LTFQLKIGIPPTRALGTFIQISIFLHFCFRVTSVYGTDVRTGKTRNTAYRTAA